MIKKALLSAQNLIFFFPLHTKQPYFPTIFSNNHHPLPPTTSSTIIHKHQQHHQDPPQPQQNQLTTAHKRCEPDQLTSHNTRRDTATRSNGASPSNSATAPAPPSTDRPARPTFPQNGNPSKHPKFDFTPTTSRTTDFTSTDIFTQRQAQAARGTRVLWQRWLVVLARAESKIQRAASTGMKA
ncbi:hypothetical protein AC579_2725 [Pseudocercospora musae]|uniref:Uncharacterized protein n=1 Tax=Pseudocercospora musae TaxID=113226 RepID=A0A139IVB7_9PEZI|nr:hypothetical protein AC579_2725 [Pseudocercospora musae]